MSLNEFNRALRLSRNPSNWLLGYLLALYFAAMISIFSIEIPGFARILMLFVLFCSAVYAMRWYLHESYDVKTEWIWYGGNAWAEKNGENTQTWLLHEKYIITPVFIILNLQNETKIRTRRLLWMRDQISSDSYRRMIVRLKYCQDEAMRIDDPAL